MSTEHQRYSTDNQMAVIQRYADHRHHEIVRTYTDSGKSGLRLVGRDALQALLQDVELRGQTTSRSWSTMSVGGAAFRIRMRRLQLSFAASEPGSSFTIALSSSRTTAASGHRSSKL